MFNRAYVKITDVCNLACSFCPGTRRPAGYMRPEDFRLLAEKLRGHTAYLYLHVMGEPLLHPQLEEILAIARQLDFRVCITTNGTLLPRRGHALVGVHKVSVSLHSFEGNDRAEGLEAYLSGVWDFCRRAAGEGTLCALRLWNIGGRDRRNGEVLDFLNRRLGGDVLLLPTDRRGNRRLAEHIFLEQAEKFDWPDPEAPESGTPAAGGAVGRDGGALLPGRRRPHGPGEPVYKLGGGNSGLSPGGGHPGGIFPAAAVGGAVPPVRLRREVLAYG